MTVIPQSQTRLILHCIQHLQTGYDYFYGHQHPEYATLIEPIATLALEAIARCDAPYHHLEHTLQVVVGRSGDALRQTAMRGTDFTPRLAPFYGLAAVP